jgi:heme/copper-type cytochrome/quinol oxidase subunit 2
MPLLLHALFWLAIALVVVSQVMVLRSTVRAMRAASSAQARRGVEWAYAVVPAIALMVALAATWDAARQHTTRLDMEAKANQTVAP